MGTQVLGWFQWAAMWISKLCAWGFVWERTWLKCGAWSEGPLIVMCEMCVASLNPASIEHLRMGKIHKIFLIPQVWNGCRQLLQFIHFLHITIVFSSVVFFLLIPLFYLFICFMCCWGSNPVPYVCKASPLPLSHNPCPSSVVFCIIRSLSFPLTVLLCQQSHGVLSVGTE